MEPKKALFPLSYCYGAIIGLRNALYDLRVLPAYRSSLPIVCVGNVTVGGSGKTPFVQFLAERMKRSGFKPVVLSRGYRGTILGPHHVGPSDSAAEVGDEAISHREKLRGLAEVVISRHRANGAKLIEEKQLGDLILLDDGFQHRALRRDFDILLLDVTTIESREKWEKGLLLPAGWLREPFNAAKRRASCLLFVSKGRASGQLPSFEDKPSFLFQFLPRTMKDIQGNVNLPTEVLRGKSIIAATGIGEPAHFFSLLRQLGANIAIERSFPDHHLFQKSDLLELSPSESRPLVVTSKDATKLKNFLSTPGQVYSLELGGGFYNLAQEQEFFKLCLEALKR